MDRLKFACDRSVYAWSFPTGGGGDLGRDSNPSCLLGVDDLTEIGRRVNLRNDHGERDAFVYRRGG